MSAMISPYGSWKSPVSAGWVAGGEIGLEQIQLDGDDIYWIERRAQEGGRKIIVRRTADGTVTDVTPRAFNTRTRVHEYGGGDYSVYEAELYFYSKVFGFELGDPVEPIAIENLANVPPSSRS